MQQIHLTRHVKSVQLSFAKFETFLGKVHQEQRLERLSRYRFATTCPLCALTERESTLVVEYRPEEGVHLECEGGCEAEKLLRWWGVDEALEPVLDGGDLEDRRKGEWLLGRLVAMGLAPRPQDGEKGHWVASCPRGHRDGLHLVLPEEGVRLALWCRKCPQAKLLEALGLDGTDRLPWEAAASASVRFDYIYPSVEPNRTVGLVEVRASDLQAKAREGGPTLESLPLLGRPGYLFRGLSHLLSGYPKVGKSELLVRVVAEWAESVLWITEEPRRVWEARLAGLPYDYGHVTLVFGLGASREVLLQRVAQGTELVVIIDTDKLLGIEDFNDQAEVTAALVPFLTACRERGKTLIVTHHERKGGGLHGEGIAGSHAFLALVDVGLELLPDPHAGRRRLIRGYGRVVAIPELVYELMEDGSMVALGEPEALSLEATKDRVLALLTEEWQTLREIMAGFGDPRPSEDQVRRALNALVGEGKADRDPPLGVQGNRAHRWRLRFGSTEGYIWSNPTDQATGPVQTTAPGQDGRPSAGPPLRPPPDPQTTLCSACGSPAIVLSTGEVACSRCCRWGPPYRVGGDP